MHFMTPPYGFTWVDRPLLGASAMPNAADELAWLRGEGFDILLSLTEDPPPRRWIDEAGLMLVHVPIQDYDSPTPEQFDKCLAVIEQAKKASMGVTVHCQAGRGRTGTVLAAYFVGQGLSAHDAIARVRHGRPGSIETSDQERAIHELAARLNGS